MLGVGIHKYNQNVDAAAVVPATPSTTPPSNGGTGSTTTGSTTTGTAAPPTGTAAPPTGTEAPPTGTGGPPTGSEAPPTGSPGPAGAPDVLIMIDTSHEIGPTNFNQIIDYIATAIAPKLPLGGSASSFLDRAGDQTNVGIVGFSDASVNIMTYYEINDLASVQDALSHLTLSYSKTNPSKALTVMNKFGFTKVDNTNVMMVLASGTQADIDAAADALSQFQSAIQNFTFVALGKAGALNLSNFSNSDNVQIFMSENYVLTPEETNDLINGLNPTGAT
uniref:VWFA domain-containing protein n=1 Tax=Panagrolaimus davidi TaxID=227884 RepID=A0A914RAI5_9BILA